MYGYILKKINFIIPLLILCFLITAECSFATPPQKAPVQQKATNEAPEKTAPNTTGTQVADPNAVPTETNNNQGDDLFSEDKKEGTSANQQSETPQNPINEFLAKNNLQMWHLLAIGGGLIVIIVIIVITMGGKKSAKYVCSKCGAKVLPGNDLCESCKNQEMMLQMESNMGQIQPNQPNVSPQNSLDMGTASTIGNIPTQAPITQQDPINPPPVAPPPPPPQPMAKKQIPTGRVVAQISIRKGANNGHRFKYYDSQNQVIIGTDKECDFQIEDEAAEDDRLPKIASRHAMITLENGSIFTIHDMSTTGMFVNNNPVKQQQLKTGDVIKIGTTELTFARL